MQNRVTLRATAQQPLRRYKPWGRCAQEYRCLSGLSDGTTAMVHPDQPWVLGYFEAAGALSNHSHTCPELSAQPGSS